MAATYRCNACNATWAEDREPELCPQCGSRIFERSKGSYASIEDHYNPPESSIATRPPVSSTTFAVLYWLGFVAAIAGYVVLLVGSAQNGAAANNEFSPLMMVAVSVLVVGGGLLLAAYIISLVKIYRAWDLIQPLRRLDPSEATMTTPGLAVGLLFVPFYNFYWNFVAIYGLATRANKYMIRSKIQARPMAEGMAQTYCIMVICQIIPCVGSLIALANAVLYFLFILDVDRMRGAVQDWRGDALKSEFVEDFEEL